MMKNYLLLLHTLRYIGESINRNANIIWINNVAFHKLAFNLIKSGLRSDLDDAFKYIFETRGRRETFLHLLGVPKFKDLHWHGVPILVKSYTLCSIVAVLQEESER